MIVKYKLKLILKPGKATPTPPIGPILGQYGLNLMTFCNKFNELTKNNINEFIHVKIIIFQNLNYEIILGLEPLTNVIKKITNIEKFSKKPGIETIVYNNFDIINIISKNRIFYEKKKISSIRKMILGTFYSLGIKYE
ncbi:50S ribosomal protein L11 [Candidatus Carsonella ruddii]|uniref:Large ribosomal subunit protein uL11 n=1 Tax=Carsonella ruddii TaxID=114186 RepID=A0A2K8K5T2_CARRU|nr:50S ribosomal protein L11 [Candidatus Carsonella ruddii]ATX33414.1 50S ribosomal protein L11 [Candidatus Carsonella ruddii]